MKFIVFLTLFLSLLFYPACNEKKTDDKKNYSYLKDTLEKARHDFYNSLNMIENHDSEYYHSSIKTIVMEVNHINDYAEQVLKFENSNDTSISSLARELKTALIEFQKKEFPILRVSYWKRSEEEDPLPEGQSYKLYGNNTTIMEYIKPNLLTENDRENLEKGIPTVLNLLKFLRFKKIIFKSSKTKVFAEYIVDSPNDEDIVINKLNK